jgi:hypothetical protein
LVEQLDGLLDDVELECTGAALQLRGGDTGMNDRDALPVRGFDSLADAPRDH